MSGPIDPPERTADYQRAAPSAELEPPARDTDSAHHTRPRHPADPSPSPRAPYQPGDAVAQFRIVRELGRGGMGVVFLARDTKLERDVALKVIRPDWAARPDATARFLREARVMASVHHDNLVEVYQADACDAGHFLAMPLLVGETLEQRLHREERLTPDEAARVGGQLASGLAALHARNLIHRDLKPSNVWLEAGTGRVKVLDLGLVRDARAEDDITNPGAVVGTPAYMSPEQASGLPLDARSDLFSLGSVLYKATTGKSPFGGTTPASGETVPPPARALNPTIPPALSELIERLHRKRPEDRPASASAVADEFRSLAGAEPVVRSRRSHRPLMLALACAAVFAGAVGVYARGRPTAHTPTPATDDPPPAVAPAAERLSVRGLDVHRFAAVGGEKVERCGAFGTGTYGATTDDDIEVTAKLSRPAYAYLIVFRADGQDAVLYPQSHTAAPEKTDRPAYPLMDRSKRYGLNDGAGLWLVALVATDTPLPAYRDWRAAHPSGPWATTAGRANVVLRDDGVWFEELAPGLAPTRGPRGEKTSPTKAPVVAVTDWLKRETGGAVSVVGFTVEANK